MAVQQRLRKLPTLFCAAIGITSVLLLGACSSSSEDDNGAPSSTSPPTSQSTQKPSETPPSKAPGDSEQSLADAVLGSWTSADPGDPNLEFTANGMVAGSDGCNGVSGKFTVDEDLGLVKVDRDPSTLRACLDVNDWLRGMQAVTVDADDYLQVYDANMEHLGQMYRTE